MVRPRIPAEERRDKKRTVRLHPSTEQWVEEHVGVDREFKDFTHLVERAIMALRERDTPGGDVRTARSKK